jgi:truncated hemoglobin YjbI
MDSTPSLHERLGGDAFIKVLLCQFYDNADTHSDLNHFFHLAPKEVIKSHNVKFFRMVFGCPKTVPSTNEILDYLLLSHSMMFQQGLNEVHFDLIAQCLVQAMHELFVDQAFINECVTILSPYRVIFVYGAEVAAKEKELTVAEKKSLPTASANTMGSISPAVLPVHPMSAVPTWLLPAMQKVSPSTTNVRCWTSNLTNRFTAFGDAIVGDILMDIPFVECEAYIASFIQLSFVPVSDSCALLKTVQNPPGFKKPKLPRVLYERMIVQFELTCLEMEVNDTDRLYLTQNLKQYRTKFEDVEHVPINGINGLHALAQKALQPDQTCKNGSAEYSTCTATDEGSSSRSSSFSTPFNQDKDTSTAAKRSKSGWTTRIKKLVRWIKH